MRLLGKLTVIAALGAGSLLFAAPPSWWTSGGTSIIDSSTPAENYAPANQGQLKNVAKKAAGYLNANLPAPGAGTEINSMVGGFVHTDGDYAPINIGQLKSVAKPFYERLHVLGYDTRGNLIAHGYPQDWAFDTPWDPSAPVATNYAPANLGQIKLVFSFDLAHDGADALPDWWEKSYFGGSGHDPDGDDDQDGLTNLQEFQQGSDPTDFWNDHSPVITIVSGNNQSGLAGQALSAPLKIKVTNSDGSPKSGASVTFSIISGGGTLTPINGGVSDADGIASATLTLPAAVDGTEVSVKAAIDSVFAMFAASVQTGSWISQDIGAVSPPGSLLYSYGSNEFALKGAGADIWGTADAFQFVHLTWAGKNSVVAKVTSVQNTNAWAKAGVMIRESTSAGSRYVMLAVTPGNGLSFQRRLTTNGSTVQTVVAGVMAPMWVKLEMRGTTVLASYSSDGSSWTLIGSDTVAMPDSARVGLAVSSHANGTLGQATFTNVLAGMNANQLPDPWLDANIGSPANAGQTYVQSGVFTAFGSGSDITSTADQLYYLYQPFTGDGRITAHLSSQQNTGAWAKTGLMFRESLAAGAKFSMLAVTPGNGSVFQNRLSTNGNAPRSGTLGASAPTWLRLERLGDLLRASQSVDGSVWNEVGLQTLPMNQQIYVGFPVTSQIGGYSKAVFDSVQVSPQPTHALPAPWQQTDVGAVGAPGTAIYDNGAFTLYGAGADIQGTADAFHFVSTDDPSDGVVVARMTEQQNTDYWAKAGLMLRDSTAAGAAEVSIVVTPHNAIQFQVRATAGGATSTVTVTVPSAPIWLKLEHYGSYVGGYYSTDGISWTYVGNTTVSFAAGKRVGLAVASHNSSLGRATFDNLSVTTGTWGLIGRYYADMTFQNLALTRIDRNVNFDWGLNTAPSPLLPPTEFAVRWVGQVQPRYTEDYSFTTTSDDGVRLWVDGELLIDDWTIHGTQQRIGVIRLKADKKYNIRLEYFEGAATPPYANVKLSWASTSQSPEVIPSNRLFPYDNDTDLDFLPDDWELETFGDLNQTGSGDYDGDQLSNFREYRAGTSVRDRDTDHDGLTDGEEANGPAPLSTGTDPLNPDSDGNGTRDYAEYVRANIMLWQKLFPTVEGEDDGQEVTWRYINDQSSTDNHSLSLASNVSGLPSTILTNIIALKPGELPEHLGESPMWVERKIFLKRGADTDIYLKSLQADSTKLKATTQGGKLIFNHNDTYRITLYKAGTAAPDPVSGIIVGDLASLVTVDAQPDLDFVPDSQWDHLHGGLRGKFVYQLVAGLGVADLTPYKWTLHAVGDPDSDHDGVSDTEEVEVQHTLPHNADSDGDNLNDGWELNHGLDPLNPDSDGDGMPDGWELQYGLNPADPADALADKDNDGLSNLYEYQFDGNPTAPNTDGDVMPDVWEMQQGLRVKVTGDAALASNYRNRLTNLGQFVLSQVDTDGDGLSDAAEEFWQTSPTNPDSDGDEMPDGYEAANSLNPAVKDATGDVDSDGVSNYDEYLQHTLPFHYDTDGDGLGDGWEKQYHYNARELTLDLGGWWRFDENTQSRLIDTSGHSNDGRLGGEATIVPSDRVIPDSGRTNYALSLVGTTSAYATIRPDPSLNATNLGSSPGLSLALWVKIKSRGSPETSRQIASRYGVFDLHFTPERVIIATLKLADGSTAQVSAAGFGSNTWHHIALTFDELTGKLQLWADGVEAGTTQVTGVDKSVALSDWPLVLGAGRTPSAAASTVGAEHTVLGYRCPDLFLDDVRLYQRPLLASEIVQISHPSAEGLEANRDDDGDTLSNLEEFLVRTAPDDCDSDDDTLTDGEEYALGTYHSPDADGDGLLDVDEAPNYAKANDADSDDDYLSDGDEVHIYHTRPDRKDTDGDHMPDWWEIGFGLDPIHDSDANLDPDSDGLTNLQEFNLKTNPKISQTFFNSSGKTKDSDGDGLSDYEEIVIYGSDPDSANTYSGTISDFIRVQSGLMPPAGTYVGGSHVQVDPGVGFRDDDDFDGDGVSNIDELNNGGFPNSIGSAEPASTEGERRAKGIKATRSTDNSPAPKEEGGQMFGIQHVHELQELTITAEEAKNPPTYLFGTKDTTLHYDDKSLVMLVGTDSELGLTVAGWLVLKGTDASGNPIEEKRYTTHSVKPGVDPFLHKNADPNEVYKSDFGLPINDFLDKLQKSPDGTVSFTVERRAPYKLTVLPVTPTPTPTPDPGNGDGNGNNNNPYGGGGGGGADAYFAPDQQKTPEKIDPLPPTGDVYAASDTRLVVLTVKKVWSGQYPNLEDVNFFTDESSEGGGAGDPHSATGPAPYILVGATSSESEAPQVIMARLSAKLMPEHLKKRVKVALKGTLPTTSVFPTVGNSEYNPEGYWKVTTHMGEQSEDKQEFHNVVVGWDANNDEYLYPDEASYLAKSAYTVRLVNHDQYQQDGAYFRTAQIAFYAVLQTTTARFFGAFLNDADPPESVGVPDVVSIHSAPWLSHNVGGVFTADGTASVNRYVFPPTSTPANEIANDEGMKLKLSISLVQHKTEVQQYFVDNPDAPSHQFTWKVPAGSIAFQAVDLTYSINEAAHSKITVTVDIDKNLIASKVHVETVVTDLYDFYYETDASNAAGARLQAGYHTMGNGGHVFKVEMNVDNDIKKFHPTFN